MIEYTVEVYENGDKQWWLNNKRHREDGPAIEGANGDKEWWLNNKRHREDGPSYEGADGGREWHLNGRRLSEAGHKKATTKTTCDGKEVEIDGVTYILKLKGQDDE